MVVGKFDFRGIIIGAVIDGVTGAQMSILYVYVHLSLSLSINDYDELLCNLIHIYADICIVYTYQSNSLFYARQRKRVERMHTAHFH